MKKTHVKYDGTPQRETSKSHHAPGPWKIATSGHNREWSHWILREVSPPTGLPGTATIMVAAVANEGASGPAEALKNARLIAAAPELLEALKRALPIVAEVYEHDGDAGHDLIAVEAAIAKAEGGAP